MIPSTSTVIQPADLLSQITALIADVDTIRADAENWRRLLRLLGNLGYGPRITPEAIADLIPNAAGIAAIAAASQETPPAAAPKSNGTGKRRIITDHDREIIRRAHADGLNVQAISNDFGYSKSTIERALHPDSLAAGHA
jgi:hypothetical protein